MHRARGAVFAGFVLNALVSSLPAMRAAGGQGQAGLTAGVVSSFALLAAAVAVTKNGPRARDAVLTACVVTLCQVIWAHSVGAGVGVAEWSGWQHVLVAGALLAATLSFRWSFVALSAFAVTNAFALRLVVHDVPGFIWLMCLLLESSVVVGTTSRELMRTAQKVDAIVEHRRAESALVDAARAGSRVEAETRRRLHDDVAYALRAVAMPAAYLDQSAVLAHVDRGVGALTLEPTTDTQLFDARLRRIARDSNLRLDLDIQVPVEPPSEVATALVGAVQELLRNVGRHSGSRRAWLAVKPGASLGSIVAKVVDEGRGFDRVRRPAGDGIKHSVEGRLQDIGATVVIASEAGRGTSAIIEWRSQPLTSGESGLAVVDLAGTRWQLIKSTLLPVVLCNSVLLVTHQYATPLRSGAFVITIGMWIVSVFLIIRARERMPTDAAVAGVVFIMLAALWGQFVLFGPDGAPDSAGYSLPGVIAPVMGLLTYVAAWRFVVGAAVVVLGSVWIIMALSTHPVLDNVVILISILCGMALVACIRVSLEHFRPALELAATRDLAAAAELAKIHIRQAVGASRVAIVRQLVLPFFAEVVRHPGILELSTTHETAARLELAVRDSIRFNGMVSPTAYGAIDLVRRAGIAVELVAVGQGAAFRYVELATFVQTAAGCTSVGGRIVLSSVSQNELTVLIDPVHSSAAADFASERGGTVMRYGDVMLASLIVTDQLHRPSADVVEAGSW